LTGQGRGGLVCQVEPGSLAQYLEIKPGDRIVSVNNRILRDEIDFRFYSASENIILDVLKKGGEKQRFEIEKDPDDLMGVTFDNPIFDRIRTCRNNCCFCFISQLPHGLRKSLYLRDDDFRLSFLFGNFISLTNLTHEDWQRIDEQRLSPLRVSLHISDPGARARLMGNPEAARAMDQLKKFRRIGISVHIQIVLLKGVNDGEKLISTLKGLESLGDTVLSVGVVPAVYTRYRKALPSPCGDPTWAREVLSVIEGYARKMYEKRGVYWVYGADEFYFLSGKQFPDYEFYDEFPQYENGIGMVADFREAAKAAKTRLKHCYEASSKAGNFGEPAANKAYRGKILAVTGRMAYPELMHAVKSFGLEGRISVVQVRNRFFGDTVTCAGLLTGQDMLKTILELKKAEKYECILIPSFSVFEGKFLDDMTVNQMSNELKISVKVVKPSPDSLIDAVLESEGD